MKNIVSLLFITLSALIMSCSDGQCTEEQPEKIESLKLDGYQVDAGYGTANLPMIEILSGNGDYSLVFPKYMTVAREKIPYPDYKSLFLFYIDESDNVVINFLWSYDETENRDDVAHGMLMVKDAEGQRKLISITYCPGHVSGGVGQHPDPDWEGPEDPGPDYWVNY